MKRRKRKRSKLGLVILGLVFIYFFPKIVFSYMPVEVIPVRVSELEDTLKGEFIVLRQERVITAPFKGYFVKVKNEGERVAKETVLGYLEIVEGTSLEKKRSLPVKAPAAGLVSYQTDGLEGICNPEMWLQLDLSKLEAWQKLETNAFTKNADKNKGQSKGTIEAGEGFCKIVDNLDYCYFYWIGVGAYPEKIKKGGNLRLRLENREELVLKGVVVDLSRKTGEYGILIKIFNAGDFNLSRKENGEIITCSYKGIVLPEKVLVPKEGQYGVYLFKKGRACWQEVEKKAQLRGQVVLSGLPEGEWVIADPQLVTEGKRVTRLNK